MYRLVCCVSLWVAVAVGATAASAESMRCQSVNGNLNCAGSDGVACQTVNGKKTCVSGHGGVVQSFGAGTPPNAARQGGDAGADMDDDGMDDDGSASGGHKPAAPRSPGTAK
jgi:hypothetical protein